MKTSSIAALVGILGFVFMPAGVFAQAQNPSAERQRIEALLKNIASEQSEKDKIESGQALKKLNKDLANNVAAVRELISLNPDFSKSISDKKMRTNLGLDKNSTEYTFLSRDESDLNGCGGLIFALRQDLADLGADSYGGGCPKAYSKSLKGAIFSFEDDRIAGNKIWNAKGLAALMFNKYFNPVSGANDSTYQLFSMSIGGYAGTNTVLNSSVAKAKSNSEIFNYGGAVELAFGPTMGNGTTWNVNGYLGGATNALTNVSNIDSGLEIVPVFYLPGSNLGLNVPYDFKNSSLWVRLDASGLFQYDQTTDTKNMLAFNGRQTAERVGWKLALNVGGTISASTPILSLDRLGGSVGYHWAYDLVSGRPIDLFSSNLSYGLDADHHFAITASYEKGHEETTGTLLDQYLIGLAAKF